MFLFFLIVFDSTDYYRQQIKSKFFSLAEINSEGYGGISSANNGLERKNGMHKLDLGYKKQGLTQYIPAAFAWLEEESARDLEFFSKMANGYAGHGYNRHFCRQKGVGSCLLAACSLEISQTR